MSEQREEERQLRLLEGTEGPGPAGRLAPQRQLWIWRSGGPGACQRRSGDRPTPAPLPEPWVCCPRLCITAWQSRAQRLAQDEDPSASVTPCLRLAVDS